MNAAEKLFGECQRLLDEVLKTQLDKIEEAAQLCADALCSDGFIFTFGTGHSHMLAEEIFYRAGGLARVYPIFDDSLMLHRAAANSSMMERMPGLAKLLLDDVDAVEYGGVMFLFSNSGCNTVAIEMAEEARARGIKTVCITNMIHSTTTTSRHPEGKKLYQVCDVVIDNKGCKGDACIDIGKQRSGPTSTAVGAAIMQAIVCRTIELCAERGNPCEVFISGNIEGGTEANAVYHKKYKSIVKPF